MTAVADPVLDDLRRLMSEATPGPWKVTRNGEGCRAIGVKTGPKRQDQHREIAFTAGLHIDEEDRANAALIVAMRNALPGLLEERDRLRKVAEAARDLLMARAKGPPIRWPAEDRLDAALAALDGAEGGSDGGE